MTLSSFKLSLPTDIPWKRICVTEDMIDPVVCDLRTVPKWQSSIAVYNYVPPDEYQQYPDVNITYLKVTVTITGYQPIDREIQGEIDWDGVDITTINGLTELLNSYFPCTGAILQVVVGPPGPEPNIPLDEYPYFLDFEPKKRELFEMATDTKERQSRSLETLNLTKSAGTTQSLEVMDVDMGGGGFGLQGTYAGTGGGFSYQAPNGQWGTKSLNSDASQVSRSVESGTEKRETFSFTTQIAQMYHLLNSYHLGTNRAVFFVQPRPHILEEPSGFVRGPRKVEGIQEFFLVVAQPKKQEEPFCLSVRLDTSHLVETDILDYEYRTDISDLASATARIPTRNDQPDGTTTREACFGFCWDVTYHCFRTHDADDQIYTAPTGFVITGFSNLVNEASRGSTNAFIAPGGKNLTVHAEANGHICFEGGEVCTNCPDEIEKWSGFARRQVQVNLRSEEPIRKVGTRQHLLITTRGLCCCGPVYYFPDVSIIDIWDIPDYLGGRHYYKSRSRGSLSSVQKRELVATESRRQTYLADTDQADIHWTEDDPCGCGDKVGPSLEEGDADLPNDERKISIRQANGIVDFIHDRMARSFQLDRPQFEPKQFIETEIFYRQLLSAVRGSRLGREKLSRSAVREVPDEIVKVVAEHLNKSDDEVTVGDIFRIRPQDLNRRLGIKENALSRFKLQLLGIPLVERKRKPDDQQEA